MTEPDPGNILRLLHSRRTVTRGVLLFERLWPAVWPAFGVAGVFVCLALLDLPDRLTPWLHVLLLAGFGMAVLFLLIRGLRAIALPDDAAADRRMEQASGLMHRPLATLSDRPSGDDPLAAALWQTHLARAAQQVRSLRVACQVQGWPRSTAGRCAPDC